MTHFRFVWFAMALAWAPSLLAQPPQIDPRLKAAAALYDGVKEHTLKNGLRVLLKPLPGAPTVCVMTAYRVGAADEEIDQTGLSHYLEHLMFKGTDKLMPGDIDKKTRRAGGQNNAYTTTDFTNYHFEFAADKWDVALEIEAERMRNLRIDEKHEFQQEKGAVIAELDGAEDEPWDLEQKAILPLLFGPTSPYGHAIIGEKAHVRAATAEQIKRHYDRWYQPNNAVLVMVGGFDPELALGRIRNLFGPIPLAKLPNRNTAAPVTRSKPVFHEFQSKFDVDRMVIGFNTVRMGDAEDYVLDVIEGVLSNGKTGRLYRKLVIDQEVAAEVRCSNLAGRLPGWFSIEMEVLNGVKPKKAEESVLEQLRRLADEPISAEELQRVKRNILASFIFSHEGAHDLADSIVSTVAMTDLDYLRNYFKRIDAVTFKDVQEVSKRLLDPEKRVVVYSKAESDNVVRRSRMNRKVARSPAKFRQRIESPATATSPSLDFSKVQRKVLPNGLTLLLWENHRLPIVLAQCLVKNVRLHEKEESAGVAALVGVTLEEGTSTRTEEQISRAIEDVGGSLSFTSNSGQLKVLTPDTNLGLELLLDCLIHPKFEPKAIARWREHLQSELDAQKITANMRAELAFFKRVYGRHPFGRSSYGSEKTLELLNSEAAREFHQTVFIPNNVILVIAGDFDPKTIVDDITRRTANWKKSELPKLNLPPPLPRTRFVEELITLPDSAQLNIYMGQLGIRRSDPDYYKLLVMDHILGIGTGFTDRLSSKLRDRNGLAYEVTASITESAGEEPGVFKAYVGTYPDTLAEVKKMLLDEITRFRKDGPTDEEVAEARNYLIGSFAFRLATMHDVADELTHLERFDLGFDYYQRFRQEIVNVSAADVKAVAQKHLDPERMVFVAAGPIDRSGKALKK